MRAATGGLHTRKCLYQQEVEWGRKFSNVLGGNEIVSLMGEVNANLCLLERRECYCPAPIPRLVIRLFVLCRSVTDQFTISAVPPL